MSDPLQVFHSAPLPATANVHNHEAARRVSFPHDTSVSQSFHQSIAGVFQLMGQEAQKSCEPRICAVNLNNFVSSKDSVTVLELK